MKAPIVMPLQTHAKAPTYTNHHGFLWLCIYFPDLSLFCSAPTSTANSSATAYESATAYNNATIHEKAIVIYHHHHILAANKKAQQHGIRPGMSLNSAISLCTDLILKNHDPEKEQKQLEQWAKQLYSFTPYIHTHPQGYLTLEISDVVHLHISLKALLIKIKKTLNQLNCCYQLALAHSEKAAELLARHSNSCHDPIDDPIYESIDHSRNNEIQAPSHRLKSITLKKLNQLTLDQLDCAPHLIDQLTAIGLKTVSDLLAMPKKALGKRYGKPLIEYLDKIIHEQGQIRRSLAIETDFFSEQLFDFHITSVDILVEPIKHLLFTFNDYLVHHQKATTHWCLGLYHDQQKSSELAIGSAHPIIDSDHLLEMTLLKLESYHTDHWITGIYIHSNQFQTLEDQARDLFEQHQFDQDIKTLINQLIAKLGPEHCYQLSLADDHRIEHAMQKHPALTITGTTLRQNTQTLKNTDHSKPLAHRAFNPHWILTTPIALQYHHQTLYYHHQPLTLITGQERINSHWWLNTAYYRDYYIAKNRLSAYYWVYFDHIEKGWFLQGFF